MLSEDLALTSLMRERGYLGLFIPDVICYEDLPHTYPKYLRRQERWIKGTTEYLIKYVPSLLRCRGVGWFEKLDVLLSAGVLLNAAPFLAYLLLVAMVLPSAATQPLGLPASMAGLPANRAWVLVGPPLSARGPSIGFIGLAAVPTWSPLPPVTAQPLLFPTRL
jgi:cellulose synthase/poly-beta-1,6-N-acetylglucosamine synthase-like glycosyltransferase